MTLDELLLEWSYRTKKGYPCLDNPSDITILKNLLETLNLPAESIIDELENEKTYADKDGKPGISGMEDSETDTAVSPDNKQIQTVSVKDIISLLDRVKDDNDALIKIKNLILNRPAESNWKSTLINNANITNKTIDTSNAPKDILNIFVDNNDLNAYSQYLGSPKNLSDLPSKGNFVDEFQDIGISQDSLIKLLDMKGAESGRGVGKGEMGLATLCGDIKMAAAGAGDLNWEGKSLEVKGTNARLGGRDRKFPNFLKSDLGILAARYDKSDKNLASLIPNIANESDIDLDELLNAVIDFEEIAHPNGNPQKYYTKDILGDPIKIRIAAEKTMAAAYISKYNIDHFIIWNSNIGGKFGNYVHFPSSEMDEMLENRTIRFGFVRISNLDPSVADGAPY